MGPLQHRVALMSAKYPQKSPLHTPGLLAWFEADRLGNPADGTALDTWPDLSGNGHDATQTGSARPVYCAAGLNSRPAVEFTAASSQYMALDSLAASVAGDDVPYTLIAVVQASDVSANRAFFSFGDSTGGRFVNHRLTAPSGTVTVNRQLDATSPSQTSSDAAGTSPAVVTIAFKGTTVDLRLNGVQQATDGALDTDAQAFDLATIGALRRNTIGAYFQGMIAALAVWDRALATIESWHKEQYFAQKWALPGV